MANHEQRPPRHDAASETPTTRRGSDTAPAAERVCLHRWVASAMRGFVTDSPTRCQPATSHAHLRPARPLSTSPPRAPSHSATKRSGTARLQSGPTSGNVSGDLATSRRTHTGGLRRARRVAPKTAPWSDVTLAPRRSEYCRPHRHCADSPVHRIDDAQPTPSTLSPAFRPSIPTPPPTTRLSIASTTPSRRPSPSGAPGPVNIDTAGLHPASARPFQAHLQRDVSEGASHRRLLTYRNRGRGTTARRSEWRWARCLEALVERSGECRTVSKQPPPLYLCRDRPSHAS